MGDDLDDFFDDVDEAEKQAVKEEEENNDRPAKKRKVIRPLQGVVVAAASSAVVATSSTKQPSTTVAGQPSGPQSVPPHLTKPNHPHQQHHQHNGHTISGIPPPPKPPPLPKKPHMRSAAGKTWVDTSLDDWPDDDFRIFVGSLGPEVTDQQLYEHFRNYPSLQLAKIVRDNKTQASKCFGFVSLGDALECARALREQDQTWLGSRPIRLKRSTWKDREAAKKKKKKRR